MTRPNLNGAQRIALQIVRQHFGEQAEEICDALMKRPKRTLKELQTDCQAIPLGQLRNGLLILIHHNLVIASVDAARKSKECKYTFDADTAVLRLRYPKFSAHIRAVSGPDAEKMIEVVLDHGRCTWEQILAGCGPDVDADNLKEVGDFLVENRYLVRIATGIAEEEPPPEPAPKPAATGKRGREEAAEKLAAKARRKEGGGAYAGAYAQIDDDLLTEGGISAPGVLWKVGTESFAWDLRGEAIKLLVADRAGPESGSLMHMLLKSIRMMSLSRRLSPSATAEQVLAQKDNIPQLANTDLTWESVSEYLMALSQEGVVRRVADQAGGGTSFQPDVTNLRSALRQDIIERVVESKMGKNARRVMGLLLQHPLLESKTVWDLAMLPKKDANEVLCRMLKHGYVGLQEVARTADHSAQRTFFLWYVDKEKVVRLIEDDMMRTMHELLLKREEKRQESEELIGVGGDISDLDAAPVQKQQYQSLQAAIERLELAILRLDETLLLLAE